MNVAYICIHVFVLWFNCKSKKFGMLTSLLFLLFSCAFLSLDLARMSFRPSVWKMMICKFIDIVANWMIGKNDFIFMRLGQTDYR